MVTVFDSALQCLIVIYYNEKCSFAVSMRSLVPHFRDRPVRPVGHSDITLYKFTQFANMANGHTFVARQ